MLHYFPEFALHLQKKHGASSIYDGRNTAFSVSCEDHPAARRLNISGKLEKYRRRSYP
jgi:hypothetical protein